MAASLKSFNFHDSQLVRFAVGPRNEVTLEAAFDPEWEKAKQDPLVIRLSAIANMPEVSAFFGKIQLPSDPDRFVDEIDELSEPRRGFVLLHLSTFGRIEIRASKITLS